MKENSSLAVQNGNFGMLKHLARLARVGQTEETMPALNITSEIGRLKRVIVHSPGPEVEAMTPKEASIDLYNDILPLSVVRREHDQLKSFLSRVSEVYELKDLLAQCLASPEARAGFLTSLQNLCPIRSLMEELSSMEPSELARSIIEGIPASPSTLAGVFSKRSFAMRPLPNAYFMRDSAAVFRNMVVASPTAFDVRLLEAVVTRFIFTHHPEFMAKGLIIDGPQERNRFITIEGGDIVVISPNLLAVGVSERTTPEGLELFAQRAGKAFGENMTILAVSLPKDRATIHLDMTFTLIDRNLALVYEPVITGPNRAEVVRIDVDPAGRTKFSSTKGLIQALSSLGLDFDTVSCGDGDELYQDREQWWSGANSFAFAPGKILMYSCNTRTLEALDRKGFAIRSSDDFLAKPNGQSKAADPFDDGRLVVTFEGIELARGGGGARCMTLPVERENLS